MTSAFDKFWKQAKFYFIEETPPLKICGNCGKEILSRWAYKGDTLLLHPDKTMCSKAGEPDA